jgi:hypothetical protein
MFELGREVTKTVNGKAYTFSRLERHIIEGFRDWIADQVGDPFADVERLLDKLPADEAKAMVKEAKETRDQLRSFSLGCPLAQRFLRTEIGMGQLAFLQLRGHHPDITPDDAFQVVLTLGAREVGNVVNKTSGAPAKNAHALTPLT